MTLIFSFIAILLIVQLVLWMVIKRLRGLPDDAGDAAAPPAYREAACWLAATIVVLILLALLVQYAYIAQRTPDEISRASSSFDGDLALRK